MRFKKLGNTNNDYSIGSTNAYYNDDVNNYVLENANFNMYVMFDTNIYTSNYKEIFDIESDYNTYQGQVGTHIHNGVNVDRYGYTWTGWFTRGYENRTERTATDGSTIFFNGTMNDNSLLVVDGHSKDLRTFTSNYTSTISDANNNKFDKTIYDSLMTFTTDKNGKVYAMTFYAGWQANSYVIYYERNDVNSVSDLKVGSSPAYQISYYGDANYAVTLTFDGTDVETTAFQRVGYTFTGFSLGQSYPYFETADGSEAKSTLVRIDYFAIKDEVDASGTSAKTTESYLYYTYDLRNENTRVKEILGDDQREFAVALNAHYEANVYKVNFNGNKNIGSTNPYFFNSTSQSFVDEQYEFDDTLTIKFDTDDWTLNDNTDISSVLVDRFGYTWMGWYTRSSCINIVSLDDSSTWANFYKYLVIAGTASSNITRNLAELNYTMFLTFFDHPENVVEGQG